MIATATFLIGRPVSCSVDLPSGQRAVSVRPTHRPMSKDVKDKERPVRKAPGPKPWPHFQHETDGARLLILGMLCKAPPSVS